MNKGYPTLSMLLLLSLHATPIYSQEEDFVKQFKQARQSIMDDYSQFRNTILTDYDQYLQGIWKEYDKFNAEKLPFEPKPKTPPSYEVPKEPEKAVSVKPKLPLHPMEIPTTPTVSNLPVMPALPYIPYISVPISKPQISIDFYGEDIRLQKITNLASMNIATTDDVTNYWKMLKKSDLKELTQSFADESRRMGLSDWASALLVEKYIDTAMPNASKNEKIIALQYVLANCGYNIRLAMGGSNVTMLIPYAEHVYEKSFITIDEKKYFIYPDIESIGSFRTCELPKDADLGKDMELKFTGTVQIGDETKHFKCEAAGIRVEGEVYTGIMPLLDAYPSVDIPTVAASVIDKKLRDNVVEQIRTQVAGLSEQSAANRILQFIQKGFQYATDEEQFGKEKYFYWEESLFYPMNDCEDRAIFYSYIVHEILGLDVHLIHFPGHECTAVAFTEPLENGTSYEYNGKRYYICDPTYIGAKIGMCMPNHADESPQIEIWY